MMRACMDSWAEATGRRTETRRSRVEASVGQRGWTQREDFCLSINVLQKASATRGLGTTTQTT